MLTLKTTLARRLLVVAGLVCASLAVIPASPAAASGIVLSPDGGECNLFTGQTHVEWLVTRPNSTEDLDKPLTITVIQHVGSVLPPLSFTIPANNTDNFFISQDLAAGVTTASIIVRVTVDGIDADFPGEQQITCRTIPNPIRVQGVAQCDPADGGATITWTVTNREQTPAFVSVDSTTPADATLRPDIRGGGVVLDSHQTTITLTETTLLTSGTANITLGIFLDIDLGHSTNEESFTSNDVEFNCAQQAPDPTTLPPTGAPNLPVTGINITDFIVVGAVLLSIGGALLVTTRRRRTRRDG